MEQVLILLLAWILYIIPPEKLNISEIFYHAMRLNDDLKQMLRTDQNALMLDIFKRKSYITTAIISVLKLIAEFRRRNMAKIDTEMGEGKYTNKKRAIDRLLSKLLFVAEKDLQDILRFLRGHINDSKVSSASLWNYLNHTAVLARKSGDKWMTILTMNVLTTDLFKRGDIPIERFILSANIGFDEDQFKIDQERLKERNLNNQNYRQTLALHQRFLQNTTNTNTSTPRRPNRRNKPKLGNIMEFHNDFLKTNLPNIQWPKDYCAWFNHPQATCKFGEKCKKHHKCIHCNGDHVVSQCPDLKKNSNKNK